MARIEQPVSLEGGGKVVTDLVFVARERNALLVVECKNGTVQEPQARRYQAMQPLDVVRTASITLDDPTAATLDVVYAVPGEWSEHAVTELPAFAPGVGVLVIDTQIAWKGSGPADPRLRAVFADSHPADLRAIPRLMPADDESPGSALVSEVANEIHATIEAGLESITVEGLVERACWGWPRYGQAFQGRLVAKVGDMLREAQKNELHGLIVVEKPTGQSSKVTIRLLAPPAAAETQAGELRGARAVRTRLDAFRARVTGRPIAADPNQLELSFEIDDADLDDDDE